VTATQPHFLSEHGASLIGSVLLHGVLVAVALAIAAYTPKTRVVTPAVIEASLVTPAPRQYVSPTPPELPAVEPQPTPTPKAAPAKPVAPPPKPAPKPVNTAPAPKVTPTKVPPGVTQKAQPKPDPKADKKADAKAKERVLSKEAESALDREMRDNEKALQAAQLKQQQDAARARAEAQARADAAAKQKADALRQQQMAGETSQYLAEVKARVERAWSRPASARKGVQCTLEVDQAPTGTVLQARVINPCNGDEAVRASIRDAALRASPLPVPKNADVFQRTLHLVFSPDE
jgi:colicin import membrane protein